MSNRSVSAPYSRGNTSGSKERCRKREENRRKVFKMLYEKKKGELIVVRGTLKTIEQAILSVGTREPQVCE